MTHCNHIFESRRQRQVKIDPYRVELKCLGTEGKKPLIQKLYELFGNSEKANKPFVVKSFEEGD